MRNYLVIALCVITLFAVALDVFLLHPRTVKAANATVVKIQGVAAGSTTPISGNVVGLSCIPSGDCVIAIQEKQ